MVGRSRGILLVREREGERCMEKDEPLSNICRQFERDRREDGECKGKKTDQSTECTEVVDTDERMRSFTNPSNGGKCSSSS